MNDRSPFSPLSGTTRMTLTATAIAIAVILLGSNFTVISAQQQQLTTGTGEIENTAGTAATPFQSTNDSFSIEVPNGWIVDDRNNTGFQLSEELRLGYGLLAQLCPEQEQGAQALSAGAASAANNATSNNRCQGAQEEIVHIIRYPDLNMRMQPTSNSTQYHLQKLQDVGYRNMQIVTTTEWAVNLTDPSTNETVQTVPAEFAGVTYTTDISPNETKTGYYILTSTNNTAPNATVTNGYAVFYEGNSGGTNNTSGAAITPTSTSLPVSTQVAQILDSFELIAAPGVAETLAQQAAEPAEFTEDAADDEVEEEEEDEGDDGGDGAEDEDDGGDGAEDEDDGGDGDGGDGDGGDGDGGDGDGGDGDGGDGGGVNLDDCIAVGGGANCLDDFDPTPDDDGE